MGISLRKYAAHRGLSLKAIQKAIQSGRISRESDGTIDTVQADADWERNTRASAASPRRPAQQASGTGGQDEQPETLGVSDYHKAHAIRVMYEAKLAKLEVGVREGKLVDLEEVNRRSIGEELEGFLGGARLVSLEELLRTSDAVFINAPLTPETHHMISDRELEMMKPDAYIFNQGRGKIIDEQALVRCLRSGKLAGAGLDVFETEPNIPKELLEMPNVVVTAHMGTSTIEDKAGWWPRQATTSSNTLNVDASRTSSTRRYCQRSRKAARPAVMRLHRACLQPLLFTQTCTVIVPHKNPPPVAGDFCVPAEIP